MSEIERIMTAELRYVELSTGLVNYSAVPDYEGLGKILGSKRYRQPRFLAVP